MFAAYGGYLLTRVSLLGRCGGPDFSKFVCDYGTDCTVTVEGLPLLLK